MELQKLLQDEIREGLYRITISGPRGDSEVSKVRIRPVEIKGKLLFQCQETVGTKEFHKNLTKDDVIAQISYLDEPHLQADAARIRHLQCICSGQQKGNDDDQKETAYERNRQTRQSGAQPEETIYSGRGNPGSFFTGSWCDDKRRQNRADPLR